MSPTTITAQNGGWKINFNSSRSVPVLADGVLYVGDADGAVFALDAKTGATKWRFQTGEGLSSGTQIINVPPGASMGDQIRLTMDAAQSRRSEGKKTVDMTPAVDNGTVYIGSGDLSFYAIDASTGKKKWSYVAGPIMSDSPIILGGVVYFCTEDGVHAVDASTGQRKWLVSTLLEGQVNSWLDRRPIGPVVAGGTLFYTVSPTVNDKTAPKGILYAVDLESGKEKWNTSFDGVDISAPVANAGLVFVGLNDPDTPPTNDSHQTNVYLVNACDGKIVWSNKFKTMFGYHRLFVAGDAIYLVAYSDIFALNLKTGLQLWSFHGEELEPAVQIDDHQLYVASRKGAKGTVHALALADGHEVWAVNGDQAAITGNGIVYVETNPQRPYSKHGVHALDTATGKELWSFKGPSLANPEVVAGGYVYLLAQTVEYIGTNKADQGAIYAMDAKTGAFK